MLSAPSSPTSLRYCIFACALVAAFITSGIAQDSAANFGQRVVIVTGIGTDETSARKNAYSRAVEESIGVVVATDTIVKDEKVISEQVLTYSGAMVSKSETLSSELKNGLFEVKIRATVEMRPLLQRLRTANVAVREFSGESVFASTITQLKQRGEAHGIILETLRDFPINVMRTEVWGPPQVVKSNGQEAIIACRIRLTIDRPRFDEFSRRLRTMLRQTGHQPMATQLNSIDVPAALKLPGFGSRKQPGMFSPFPEFPTDAYYLFVHAQSDPTDSRSTWEIYRIRPELAKTLFLLSVNSLRLTIRFLNAESQEMLNDKSGICFENGPHHGWNVAWSLRSPISCAFGQSRIDRFDYQPFSTGGSVGINESFRRVFQNGRDNFIYISPYFSLADGEQFDLSYTKERGANSWGLQRSYTMTTEFTREIKSSLDLLPTVTKVTASLSSEIPLPPDPRNFSKFLKGLSFDDPKRSEQLLTESLAPGPMISVGQPEAWTRSRKSQTQPAGVPQVHSPDRR
jgi:hypothetical protein